MVTIWSVTVEVARAVKVTRSRMPEDSEPPAVITPRTVVVPMLVWFELLLRRMPPSVRFRTSVAFVKARSLVKPPPKRSRPVLRLPAGSVVVSAAVVATRLVIEVGLKP
jgi:hypothetical protein